MDFAPAFFSLCAFVVGVMWVDTIASEVRTGYGQLPGGTLSHLMMVPMRA